LDESLIGDIVTVGDDDVFHTGIRLAKKTGILAGPTTGAILYAALQYAKHSKGLAVVISPDDAFKHITFYRPYVKDASKPKV
jgi:cysteine synthase